MATKSEVDIISNHLQDTEDWLYEEGDDESEQVYIKKLQVLTKVFKSYAIFKLLIFFPNTLYTYTSNYICLCSYWFQSKLDTRMTMIDKKQ